MPLPDMSEVVMLSRRSAGSYGAGSLRGQAVLRCEFIYWILRRPALRPSALHCPFLDGQVGPTLTKFRARWGVEWGSSQLCRADWPNGRKRSSSLLGGLDV